jgi:hypothetical protein
LDNVQAQVVVLRDTIHDLVKQVRELQVEVDSLKRL